MQLNMQTINDDDGVQQGDAVDLEKKHGTDFKAEPNEIEGKEMVMKDIKEIEEKEFMSQSLMKREKSISESTSTEVIRNCENEEKTRVQ